MRATKKQSFKDIEAPGSLFYVNSNIFAKHGDRFDDKEKEPNCVDWGTECRSYEHKQLIYDDRLFPDLFLYLESIRLR